CANCFRAPRPLSSFSSFIKSTIDLFQSKSSSCSSASFARIASTSALEIGFAAAEGAEVPWDGAPPAAAAVDGEGAVTEPTDGDGAEEPAAAVTLAACLEPKIADTMLPKTLISSS